MSVFGKLRKPRFLVVYALIPWMFVVAHTTRTTLHLGVVVVICGELIRLWANGYVGHVKVNWTEHERGRQKIGRLITAGPYAFIRHPLYFGTFLIGAGILIIVGSFWFGVVVPILFLLIYRRKIEEEETTLCHEWPEEFERYRQVAPRWLPTWNRYPHRDGQWNWEGIVTSKEPKTLAWVIVLLVLLFFREHLIQMRQTFLQKHGIEHVCILGLLVAAILGDTVFEIVLHRTQSLTGSAGDGR